MNRRVRPAAVAGMFYPRDEAMLARITRQYLSVASEARRHSPGAGGMLRALIVPHAGYIYSGPIAATAYALLAACEPHPTTVVLFGPAHRVPFHGLCIPTWDAFAIPTGEVPLDKALAESLSDLDFIQYRDAPHEKEHSIEVQLPFLSAVLGEFRILPILVGQAQPAQIASAIGRLWQTPGSLVIVSSDLSHYLPASIAASMDRETVERIIGLDPDIDPERACGATAIAGLVTAAAQAGFVADLLDLRSSADTAGDPESVVGYAAIAFGCCARGRDTGPAGLEPQA